MALCPNLGTQDIALKGHIFIINYLYVMDYFTANGFGLSNYKIFFWPLLIYIELELRILNGLGVQSGSDFIVL